MYCPRCGVHVADTARACQECSFDMQKVAQLVYEQMFAPVQQTHPTPAEEQAQHWKRQCHTVGTLLFLGSFLIGSFIPLCIGLFSWYDDLPLFIILFFGIAGVMFVLGAVLLLVSNNKILFGGEWRRPSKH